MVSKAETNIGLQLGQDTGRNGRALHIAEKKIVSKNAGKWLGGIGGEGANGENEKMEGGGK